MDNARSLRDHIDHRPRLVVDVAGNLWRYYNDVGYLLLITAAKTVEAAQPTYTALNEYAGPLQEVVIPGA